MSPRPASLPAGRAAFRLGTSCESLARSLALGAYSLGLAPFIQPRLSPPHSPWPEHPTHTVARASYSALPTAYRPLCTAQSCSGLSSGWDGVAWGAGAAPPAAPSTSLRGAAAPEPGSPLTVNTGPPTGLSPSFHSLERSRPWPEGAHGSEAQPWRRRWDALLLPGLGTRFLAPRRAQGTLGTTAHRAFPRQPRGYRLFPVFSAAVRPCLEQGLPAGGTAEPAGPRHRLSYNRSVIPFAL